MSALRAPIFLVALGLLAACQSGDPSPAVGRAEPAPQALGPAVSGCWATDRIPAQTRSEFVVTGPDGARALREIQVAPAQDRLFAVPCAEHLGPDFTATLQRALQARGLYTGAITGAMNDDTAQAVRRYQAPQGLDSAILSLQAAQQMGLVPVGRLAN
ncbi:MAG: peptidoglycan-binding domain-containing protein [Paracoccaceae bacterium]